MGQAARDEDPCSLRDLHGAPCSFKQEDSFHDQEPLIIAGMQVFWGSHLRWDHFYRDKEEILLVVPPTHRLAGQKRVPLREVAHEAVVIEKVGNGLRDLVDTFCQQAGFTPRIPYEIDEPGVVLAFVKARLGVAFAPALIKKQIHEQGLRALHLTNPTCERTLGIAWQEKHYLSQAAHAFRQFVMEYLATLE